MNLLHIYDSLLSAYGHQHWWPAESQDEMIIGAILTQNTSWTNVERAIVNLKKSKKCSLKSIAVTPVETIALLIKPSGYFNQKAERLIHLARSLDKDMIKRESLAEGRKILLGLKGIGPETADSILLYGFEKPIFVIDTYTKRIFTRLGLKLKDTKYQSFQDHFMSNLPHEVRLFNEYHALIVRHAKYFCQSKPKCEDCNVNVECKRINVK